MTPARRVIDASQMVVSSAVAAVDGTDGASLTLVVADDASSLQTTGASCGEFRRLDDGQCLSGQGPGVEAIRSGREKTFPHDSHPWPTFTAQAHAAGVRSVWSLPLAAQGRTLGALNLYTTTGDGPRSASVGRSVAAMAAALLHAAEDAARAEEISDNLRMAVTTRDVIGQAKGILMARQNIRADEAFDALRRASQSSHRRLHDVAVSVVARHHRWATMGAQRTG